MATTATSPIPTSENGKPIEQDDDKPIIGIVSIGEMGLGIAKLLQHHGYTVMTTVEGRSERTTQRARASNITALPTDAALVEQASIILSIVPPHSAYSTAQRISAALAHGSRSSPLIYVDLNAISPSHAREISTLFPTPTIFIDGCIIGGAPSPSTSDASVWKRPRIPLSGPTLPSALTAVLNAHTVSDQIGTASGLKCTFAALTKGLQALAVQSFSTAAQLGVVPDLVAALEDVSPRTLDLVRGTSGMPPKAYRWVGEMREIGKTFHEEGGWDADEDVFGMVAGVYDVVAEGVLGQEVAEERKRGRTVEDVGEAVAEGLRERKRRRTEREDEGKVAQ